MIKGCHAGELIVSDLVWQLLYFFLFFSEMTWYNNKYV